MPQFVVPAGPPATILSNNAVEQMIDEVSSLIGGQEDPDARQKAIVLLDRSADHMNMNGIVMYRRTEQTYQAGTDFTTNSATLALPTDFGWPDDRAYVYDNQNKLINTIEWEPWEVFRLAVSPTTSSTPASIPVYMSIKTEVSESLIYLWPFPDTAKVDHIIFPYFRKIQRPSETDTLIASAETREALLQYAEYLIMRYRYNDRPAIYEPFKAAADETMRRAKAAAMRSEIGWHVHATPDETGRLADPSRSQPFGAVYIRLVP